MKVLQVMPNFELAGAQTMCENLSLELKKRKDIKIEVLSFYDLHSDITKRLEKNNIKVHYLGKRKGLDFKLYIKIKKIIDDFEPNIIHTHLYALEYIIPIISFCKKKNIKIIHTIHNVAEKEVPKKLQIFQKRWFRKGLVLPVAISEIVRDSIECRYGIKKCEIPVIYNGIDLSKCKSKNNYDFNNIILHIGRFSEQKNHSELIEMFYECYKKNKKLKLYLVGTGELRKQIEDQVNKMKINNNVFFKGALSDCYSIMNEADIFVLPSKWEGMPMTLIEAMGTGLPCIAYPVGGIPDMIINEKNGYLAQNKKDFIDKILLLSNNEKKREALGKKAIESSYQYSSEIMSKKYLELYK